MEQYIRAHIFDSETAEVSRHYARRIGELLSCQVEYHPAELPHAKNGGSAELDTAVNKLIVVNDPPQTRLNRFIFGVTARHLTRCTPASVLLVRQPRWPLQNILLVLRSDLGDETAVDWVNHLVKSNGAAVTVLPIVPVIPSIYRHNGAAHLGENAEAKLKNAREIHLARLACWLIGQHTTATLRVRLGEPKWQIRQEIAENPYDLVVLAAEPYGRLSTWLFGELVGPLLDWIDRPVLITRPTN
ncbi:MAG: universal stress protein [Anaerolineae bacterium]|nr:universal stress protein [Anaerolineae bacterium]